MKLVTSLFANFARIFLGVVVLYSLLSCTKPADYAYFHPEAGAKRSVTKKVVDITGNENVDIFWLIGAMTEQEANFKSGIDQFMQTFVTKNLNWRMEVVCDNTTNAPFLGAPTVFDKNSPQPGLQMVSAVAKAVDANDAEEIFDPVMQNLKKYPNFLRPGATLVLVITNDDYEHSTRYTKAQDVLKELVALKGGDPNKVIVYGVFGSTDLNCQLNLIDSNWKYKGSEFEKLINLTGGKNYSLCDYSFGAQLAKLGDNLYQKLETPRLTLDTRPDPRTLKVLYKNKELQGGPKAKGGMWYFDVNTNSIVFYDLTFIQTGMDDVTIQYTEQTDAT